ncbi:PP2C family protein-serine/threonine phosphatase [Candidatus Chrysopegis kryptomonas]|uniref:Sigma-B regulation protein RsbU (Phosphoserine phosphatase) n=1 Tax=Candidatus Chryseopegocella kryptomonas TaxID=1633643 RepID=A0A0N7MVI4_9BACT|nr:PP2C family protein-serine/threonine phosphatase [Candidatus Chrysopegis kryptomonas]CUS95931.1 sigma-B regulation protein RsbU (phosphoserine phosphatase) [Candidatus Chrysopegis kryptomonas]
MNESEAIFTLESIFNFGKALASSQSQYDVLKISLLSLLGKLKISKGVALIFEDGSFKVVYAVGLKFNYGFKISSGKIPEGITKLSRKFLKNFGFKFSSFISRNKLCYLVPIRWGSSGDFVLALILLGCRDKKFTHREIEYINFIANFTALSLKNIASILDLKRNIYDLKMINEFTQSVLLKKDDEEIFESLALTLMGHFKVEGISVVEFDGAKQKIFSFPKSFEVKKSFLRKILHLDENLILEPAKFGFKNLSLVLFHKNVSDGRVFVLILGKRKENLPFEISDVELIRTIFIATINAIENLKMLSLNYDMKLAYEIQKNLLPKKLPDDDRIEISALSIPSKVVSGDYYDVIQLSEDEIIVAIADVCGKGVSASLLMSNLQASLKSFLLFSSDIKSVVQSLNKIIQINTSPEQFITFFICKIDLRNFVLEYVNAGHNPPILFKKSRYEFLEKGGAVLGVLDDEYEVGKVKIENGDLIFLYTDGVIEAMNSNGEEIGLERVISFLNSNVNLPAGKIVNSIKDLISSFSYGVEQVDDITLLVLKIK